MLYRYFYNLFYALDQLANALIGGDPDETISSRVGKCQRGDHGRCIQIVMTPIALLINLIFIWQEKNHCINSIEDDEGQRDLFIKYR